MEGNTMFSLSEFGNAAGTAEACSVTSKAWEKKISRLLAHYNDSCQQTLKQDYARMVSDWQQASPGLLNKQLDEFLASQWGSKKNPLSEMINNSEIAWLNGTAEQYDTRQNLSSTFDQLVWDLTLELKLLVMAESQNQIGRGTHQGAVQAVTAQIGEFWKRIVGHSVTLLDEESQLASQLVSSLFENMKSNWPSPPSGSFFSPVVFSACYPHMLPMLIDMAITLRHGGVRKRLCAEALSGSEGVYQHRRDQINSLIAAASNEYFGKIETAAKNFVCALNNQ
jgi:hypothetical protein